MMQHYEFYKNGQIHFSLTASEARPEGSFLLMLEDRPNSSFKKCGWIVSAAAFDWCKINEVKKDEANERGS